MTEKPAEEGRVASMVSALKKLLTDAPLIFIVAIGILLPLSAGVGANALAFEWENTIALVLVLSGVIILVVIPLMVIYTYRENQRELSSARLTAIEGEAERRTEQERNKQKRLNEVFDAKIEVLKAEKDYILDQSERHERRLLKETSETLAKEMTKGLEFTEKAEKFDLSVTEVITKLEANEIKFDSVIESLEKISRGLESPGAAEPSEDEADLDFQSILVTKDRDIVSLSQVAAGLIEERDKLKSYVKVLEEKLEPVDTLPKEDGTSTRDIKPGISNDLPPPMAYDSESERMSKQSLEEALKVVDGLEDSAPQEHDPQFLVEQEQNRHVPHGTLKQGIGPYGIGHPDDKAEVRPADPSPNYWTCPKCNRPNILKRPRCRCGTSKPL